MKKDVDIKQMLIIIGGIALTIACIAYAAWPFIRDRMESSKMAQANREWEAKEKAAGRSGLGGLQVVIPGSSAVVPAPVDPAAPTPAEPPGVEPSAASQSPAQPVQEAKPVPETAPLVPEAPNPFLTKEEREIIKKRGILPVLDYLTVNAIIVSPSGSQAVIDGRILREGDIIDGKQIVRIEPEQVICKDSFREYMIRIGNVVKEPEE
ncbi:MAG TPA: hypothetical protein P5110_05470 [Candidatus Omnitrophota bacterium]|nr:hypothetical protein [Candidatus Omnitrophota bacterium]